MNGSQKLWNRPYVCLIIINLLSAFSFYVISTLLAKFLISEGITVALAGGIVGIFSVTSLFFRPLCGFITDSLERRKLLLFSMIGMAIAIIGYVLTSNITILFLARVLHGIMFCINSTVIITAAKQFIPYDRLGEGIGYFGLGQVIASAVGPGFGTYLTEQIGIRGAFASAAILCLSGALLVLTIPHGSRNEKRRGNKIHLQDFVSIGVLDLTFINAAFAAVNGIVTTYLLLYAQSKGISHVSVYFILTAIVMFVIRPWAGKAMDKKGLSFLMYPALIFSALSMLFLGWGQGLAMVLLSGILKALGQGIGQISIQTACVEETDTAKSGVAMSTFYLGSDVGQGLGSMVGGAVVSGFGYQSLFYGCTALMVLMILFYLFVAEKRRK